MTAYHITVQPANIKRRKYLIIIFYNKLKNNYLQSYPQQIVDKL